MSNYNGEVNMVPGTIIEQSGVRLTVAMVDGRKVLITWIEGTVRKQRWIFFK